MEITARLVFLIVFVLGLSTFLYWDRKKVTRHYIIFYRRTKRGLDDIDRLAKKFPRFWNYYGWSAIFTGLLSVVVSLVLIGQVIMQMGVTYLAEYFGRERFASAVTGLMGEYGNFVVNMISESASQNGPSLLLPGLVSQNQFQAGVSFIPVEYWVIGIGVLMFVHEMSHGVVAKAEGFELNSVGWVVMGILPGAFVEPKGENMLPGDEVDTEESSGGMWDQGDWKSRLKVLGAGSFANYLTAVLFLVAGVAVSGAVTQPGNTQLVYNAIDGYPAAEQGMTQGVIRQVDGVNVSTQDEFQSITGNVSVGETVTFRTSEGNFTVEAVEREGEDDGFIGIQYAESNAREVKNSLTKFQGPLQWFISLLWTVGLLNLMIGLFNMLPIKPLDGGLMTETLIERYLGEERIHYIDSFSGLGWLIIIGAIIAAVVGL